MCYNVNAGFGKKVWPYELKRKPCLTRVGSVHVNIVQWVNFLYYSDRIIICSWLKLFLTIALRVFLQRFAPEWVDWIKQIAFLKLIFSIATPNKRKENDKESVLSLTAGTFLLLPRDVILHHWLFWFSGH